MIKETIGISYLNLGNFKYFEKNVTIVFLMKQL